MRRIHHKFLCGATVRKKHPVACIKGIVQAGVVVADDDAAQVVTTDEGLCIDSVKLRPFFRRLVVLQVGSSRYSQLGKGRAVVKSLEIDAAIVIVISVVSMKDCVDLYKRQVLTVSEGIALDGGNAVDDEPRDVVAPGKAADSDDVVGDAAISDGAGNVEHAASMAL